jgi:hypothetical protein
MPVTVRFIGSKENEVLNCDSQEELFMEAFCDYLKHGRSNPRDCEYYRWEEDGSHYLYQINFASICYIIESCVEIPGHITAEPKSSIIKLKGVDSL